MRSLRRPFAKLALALAFCSIAGARAHANEALLARLAVAMGSPEGRILLTETEPGRALVAKLLGGSAARQGHWAPEELAGALRRVRHAELVQEDVYRRFQFVKDRAYCNPEQRLSAETLASGAERLLQTRSFWNQPLTEIGRFEFIDPPAEANAEQLKEIFTQAAAPPATPSRLALARLAQTKHGFLLNQTSEGQILLERILASDPGYSPYRSGASWDRALEILARPGYEGLAIDLDQRLRIAAGEISIIHPGADGLSRRLMSDASAALAIETAAGPGGQILFKPIRGYVRDAFRAQRWEL